MTDFPIEEAHIPSDTSIQFSLSQLAELRAQRDLLAMDYEKHRREVLAKVATELAEIEDEFAPNFRVVDEMIGQLEDMLKRAALLSEHSVAGEALQVVYSKPKTTWDSAKLEGYAAAHPEILAFRKRGEPSVSIQSRRTK